MQRRTGVRDQARSELQVDCHDARLTQAPLRKGWSGKPRLQRRGWGWLRGPPVSKCATASVMETILPTRQPAHRGLGNAVQRVGSPGAVTSWGPTADQRLARGAIAPRQNRGLFNHLVSAGEQRGWHSEP